MLVVYTGCPKPNNHFLRCHSGADVRLGLIGRCVTLLNLQRDFICSAMRHSLQRAGIAPAIAENMSEPVPAMTRAVNVDALNSCSAYRTSDNLHCLHPPALGEIRRASKSVPQWTRHPSPPQCVCRWLQSDTQYSSIDPRGSHQSIRDIEGALRRKLHTLQRGRASLAPVLPARDTNAQQYPSDAPSSATAPALPSRPAADHADRAAAFACSAAPRVSAVCHKQ